MRAVWWWALALAGCEADRLFPLVGELSAPPPVRELPASPEDPSRPAVGPLDARAASDGGVADGLAPAAAWPCRPRAERSLGRSEAPDPQRAVFTGSTVVILGRREERASARLWLHALRGDALDSTELPLLTEARLAWSAALELGVVIGGDGAGFVAILFDREGRPAGAPTRVAGPMRGRPLVADVSASGRGFWLASADPHRGPTFFAYVEPPFDRPPEWMARGPTTGKQPFEHARYADGTAMAFATAGDGRLELYGFDARGAPSELGGAPRAATVERVVELVELVAHQGKLLSLAAHRAEDRRWVAASIEDRWVELPIGPEAAATKIGEQVVVAAESALRAESIRVGALDVDAGGLGAALELPIEGWASGLELVATEDGLVLLYGVSAPSGVTELFALELGCTR